MPLFSIKGACEVALERSGLEYTILEPTVFMEVWIGMVAGLPLTVNQPITLIGRGDHHHNFVSEADVAAFAIATMDYPGAANRRVTIGGPASCTWTEIVETIGRTMGVSLPVQYLPLGSQVPLLPDEVGGLLNGMETYETYVDMSETALEYGVELTTIDDYIRHTFVR